MTALPRIAMDDPRPRKAGEVLLGEDWVSPDGTAGQGREARGRRGLIGLNRSPLARKIVIFNLMALIILVGGVLFLNPFRDSMVLQREAALVREAELVANLFELQETAAGSLAATDHAAILSAISLGAGVEVSVYDLSGRVLATHVGTPEEASPLASSDRSTFITDFLNAVWDGVSLVLTAGNGAPSGVDRNDLVQAVIPLAVDGQTAARTGHDPAGGTLFSVATPILAGGQVAGVVALTTAEGEIDRLVRHEREQILQMFVVALVVSIGLSLVLASTIANPLSDLAVAAEVGRDRDHGGISAGRVRIPDLAARPDEIGRLSVAMRGMVAALYDRIDANEQFAADVAHEIKNPLASLRSAVGSLRMVKKEEHREKLLDVIEHDVRRLDRLVSDISNASRLDSELVKEQEEEFNLIKTLSNLGQYLGKQTAEKGVDFITDLPAEPIMIRGLRRGWRRSS
jgi:two-component system sensor histidine kinase ChvG